jgi:hypothetical protein
MKKSFPFFYRTNSYFSLFLSAYLTFELYAILPLYQSIVMEDPGYLEVVNQENNWLH